MGQPEISDNIRGDNSSLERESESNVSDGDNSGPKMGSNIKMSIDLSKILRQREIDQRGKVIYRQSLSRSRDGSKSKNQIKK